MAVWGIGGEGRAAARAALRAGAADVVALVDGAPSAEALASWADAGLDGVPVLPPSEGAGSADVTVLSPGVSRYRPDVLALEARGVVLTGGTELFLAEHGARTVAVTGSKGKSTVSRLTAHLLAAAGTPAVAAGNIGTALLDLLPQLAAAPAAGPGARPFVVAEVSSYQAAFVASPARVAVLTSLFPDHLPWHGSVGRYYGDKLRLFSAGAATGLVNGADPGVRALLADPALAGAQTYGDHASRVRLDGEGVLLEDAPVLGLAGCRLPGAHNRVNVAAAVAVLDALGVDVPAHRAALEEALAGFAPLPHRLEPVGAAAGVTYVDDSLATSAQAAVAACEAYPGRPLTLLAGGLDRGIDYEPLARYLVARTAEAPLAVVTMGDAGTRLAEALDGVAVERADDVADAVRLAAKLTPSGGVVLFSPAAPSPPEYGSYERRSAVFVAAVRGLTS